MHESRPWYRDFFLGDYRGFWHPQDDPERDVREVEGALALLGLEPGQKVLDLACGQGRHCVELARRGLAVTGLDLSESLLDEARRRTADAGLDVRYVQADMREIPFVVEFDAIINMFTAFGYLESDEEDLKVLRAAARALKPAGALLLDLSNPDGPARRPGGRGFREWRELGPQRFLLAEHFILLHPRRWRIRVIVLDGAEQREHEMHLRAYSADDLDRMMSDAGFAHVEAYGGVDGSELTVDSLRMVVVGRL